jgi:hypothetical protein
MNLTRKTERGNDGVMTVALTPEEQAKWDDLFARLEQVEIALADAKRVAIRKRSEMYFFWKYRRSIVAQMRPLHQIQFPEFYLK